jgi:hypothetical protein
MKNNITVGTNETKPKIGNKLYKSPALELVLSSDLYFTRKNVEPKNTTKQ